MRSDPPDGAEPLRVEEAEVRLSADAVLRQLRAGHVPFVLIQRPTHAVIRPTDRLVRAMEDGQDLDVVLDSPASLRKQQLGHAKRNSALRSRTGPTGSGAAGAVAVTIRLPGQPPKESPVPKLRFRCNHAAGHVLRLSAGTHDGSMCPRKLADGTACPGRLFRF